MVHLSSTIVAVTMLMWQIKRTTQIEPFCVTLYSNINGPTPAIDFDAECFEPGEEPSGFDLITDTFSPPYTGLYWLHFTAGLPDTGDLTDVQLALPTRTINIQRSAGGIAAVSSRSDIVELTAGVDRLQLSSSGGQFSNVSDVQVSWSGFHLDSTMNNVAAFSVAMSPGTYTGFGRIPFDVVFVDTHSGWNSDHYYTIPIAGLWVMSLHVGNSPQEDYIVAQLILTPSEYLGFGILSWYAEGSDMNSITFVAKVNVGTVVATDVDLGNVYSDIHYQSAMSGILYSPTVQPAVAWTVALSADVNQIGPVDPAQFGNVLVNEGNGFDVITSSFIAPHGGLYYVAITGSAYREGADMKMELLLNGNIKASVYYDEENKIHEYGQSRSRAIILRLSVGDELRVRIPVGYQIFSWNDSEYNVFTGFRISP